MYTVNLTRKFRRAALIALPLALMACGTGDIVGVQPLDATFARKAPGGTGKLVWALEGTYYDYDTHTFHYQISGLASNQAYTISATASVLATYDCVHEEKGLYIANAYEGAPESINGGVAGQATEGGEASGSFQLAPSGSLRCKRGMSPSNFTVTSTRSVTIKSDPLSSSPL